MSHITHLRLAVVLAVVVALGPFALDAYLPAFSAIAKAFGSTTRDVGLTLSVYVIALAAGQLIGGPISDRFGRGPVIFGGLAIFVAGSLVTAASDSLDSMLVGRIIQAFGGGWSTVNVPAIVRDRTEGNETARLFSLIAMIMFVAPAIAPSVGTLLLAFGGWRSIFVFLAVYAVLAALLLWLVLFRTAARGPAPSTEPLHRLLTNYRHVLFHGESMRFIIMQAMAFSIMLIYLTHAAFIYQEWMDFDNAGFSLLFALNVGVMSAMSFLNRRLLLRRRPTDVLLIVLAMQAGAIALLASVVFLGMPRLLAIPLLALVVGSLGAIAPNNMASALQFFRRLAGTAAAFMGATQFAISGLVGSISTLIPGDEMEVVVGMMAACAVMALLLAGPARRAAVKREDTIIPD